METPLEGEESVDRDEVIDVMTPENKDKGGGDKDAAADAKQRQEAVDDQRQEPAERSARGDDDQDGDRERDPPRRRDESDDDYSRRVRGRINRERALRLKAERRSDEQTIANNELRDRLARLERAQKATNIEGDASKKLSEINTKLEATKIKLAAAIEGGDTAKQLEINIELSELIAEKKIIEKRTEYLANEARTAAAAGEPGDDEPDPEKKRVARMTSKWQRENRNWWNLRRFSDVRTDAVELDKAMRVEVSDGTLDLQEYSDEYFAELSTRLKELYPDLDVRGLDGERIEAESDDLDRDARNRDDDRDADRGSRRGERDRDARRPAPPPRRHPAGNMGSNDRRRGSNDARTLAEQGRVRLTPADHVQMREYGLDPNSPRDKKAFAKERMRTILSEGREPQRGSR